MKNEKAENKYSVPKVVKIKNKRLYKNINKKIDKMFEEKNVPKDSRTYKTMVHICRAAAIILFLGLLGIMIYMIAVIINYFIHHPVFF